VSLLLLKTKAQSRVNVEGLAGSPGWAHDLLLCVLKKPPLLETAIRIDEFAEGPSVTWLVVVPPPGRVLFTLKGVGRGGRLPTKIVLNTNSIKSP